jgi:hypothetical protein
MWRRHSPHALAYYLDLYTQPIKWSNNRGRVITGISMAVHGTRSIQDELNIRLNYACETIVAQQPPITLHQ